MTATDLLRLAGALTETEVNRLAHALGWPDLSQLCELSPAALIAIRWAYPTRNWYNCGPGFPLEEWRPALEAGLVERALPMKSSVTFLVTPLGQAVTAIHLQARIIGIGLANEATQ